MLLTLIQPDNPFTKTPSWITVIGAAIIITYIVYNEIIKVKDRRKKLSAADSEMIDNAVNKATESSKRIADEYKNLYEAEHRHRELCENDIKVIKTTVEELRLRLLVKDDAIEKLEMKCNLVTEFNLNLQGQLDKLCTDLGLEIKVIKPESVKR